MPPTPQPGDACGDAPPRRVPHKSAVGQWSAVRAALRSSRITDGIDVLWDFSKTRSGEGLIVGGTNQHVIKEIVADHMEYIAFDSEGIPEQLTLSNWQPAKVIVNMRRSFGQPIFAATGTRVADVAGMMKAGESAETVADEFGIDIHDARAAARILLGRAA